MFKRFLLCFFGLLIGASTAVFANEHNNDKDNAFNNKQEKSITLEQLNALPKSFTKDFYIWQFLQQNITPNEAKEALGQANWVNNKLFFEYAKKINHDETYAIVQCMQANAKELIHTNDDCIALGLSTYKTLQLSYQEKLSVIEKLKPNYTTQSQVIEVLNAPLPFTKLLSAKSEVFFTVFNKSGHTFRQEYLNYTIPVHILNNLSAHKAFNQSIKLIVTNPNLSNLQQSLLNEFNTQNLTHQSLFLLSLNALQHDKKELSLKYLQQAYHNAYFQIDKDKALFWQYLITEDETFLKTILNSWEINIYSIFAHEYFEESLNSVSTPPTSCS